MTSYQSIMQSMAWNEKKACFDSLDGPVKALRNNHKYTHIIITIEP